MEVVNEELTTITLGKSRCFVEKIAHACQYCSDKEAVREMLKSISGKKA
jgi:hypothetical protein